MYYSSESSDSSDSLRDNKSLDLSYLMLDSESLANYLKNSAREQYCDEVHPKYGAAYTASKKISSLSSNRQNTLQEHILVTDIEQHLAIEHEKSKLEYKMETLSSEAVGSALGVSSSNSEAKASTDYYAAADHQLRTLRLPITRSRNGSESSDGEGFLTQDNITEKLYLNHNLIIHIPFELVLFHKLKFLDLSNNNLTQLNDFILQLPELQTLYVKNNQLDDDSLPKDLSSMTKIREINLSGNLLTIVPPQLYQITSLRYLYLGSNRITEISPDIRSLQR